MWSYLPTKLDVHCRCKCNCTAVWQDGKHTEVHNDLLQDNRGPCTPRRGNSSLASLQVTHAEVPSVVHHAFPRVARPYSSASSIHRPFQARICKHDQHKCTVSSPTCRDIGHREASRVDSGAQNSASSGILGTQATCSPSNLPFGSDLNNGAKRKMRRGSHHWLERSFKRYWKFFLMLVKEGARQPSRVARQSWTLTCAPRLHNTKILLRDQPSTSHFPKRQQDVCSQLSCSTFGVLDMVVAQGVQQDCSACAAARA